MRFQNSQGSGLGPHIGVGSSIGGLGGFAVGGAGGALIGGGGLAMGGVPHIGGVGSSMGPRPTGFVSIWLSISLISDGGI